MVGFDSCGQLRSSVVQYRDGGRYQVYADFYVPLPEMAGMVVEPWEGRYLEIDSQGNLRCRVGYAWDGPSGPALHTTCFMRPSLVHDALYELLRAGVAGDPGIAAFWRKRADAVMFRLGREDGMWWIRAWWTYLGVRAFGWWALWGEDDVRVAPSAKHRRADWEPYG
jgi:hypothetical protein